jgi:dTDP-4-dehydrorhamnose reductase
LKLESRISNIAVVNKKGHLPPALLAKQIVVSPMTSCLESAGLLPLLITGVAGVQGFNAFHYFRARYGDRVIGLRPIKNWPLVDDGIVPCDMEDTRSFRQVVEQYGIRSVLSCGGSCALKSCELDPQMADRVNVQSIRAMLDSIDPGLRLVHTSIDLVFSGNAGGDYLEDDPTDPVTVYGKTMVEGERMIVERHDNYCILRISLPMGVSFNGHAGAIDWIQNRFACGLPATLYYDEVRTPTYVDCLHEVFERVLTSDITGIYHAGGPRKVSLFEIAQVINRVGGYDPDLLHGCYRIEAGPIPPRAGDVTMDSSKLTAAFGTKLFDAWPLDPSHVPDGRDWHYDRSTERGSYEVLIRELYQNQRRRVSI